MCISSVHRCANFAKVKMYGVQVFKECQTRDASGNSFELSMVGCKCIGAYVKNKKNQNQVTKFYFIRLFTFHII